MTLLAEKDQGHLHVSFDPEGAPHDGSGTNPISSVERLALSSFLSGEGTEVLWQQLDDWAGLLAAPATRRQSRVRHVARRIAALEARIIVSELRRDRMLSAGDFSRAMLLDRMLLTDSRRLEGLLREHRASCDDGARSVTVSAVAVGDRPQVNVIAVAGE